MELHDRNMSADSDEAEIFQPPRFEREELPPVQRAEKFMDFMRFLDEINRAAPLLDLNDALKDLKATAERYKIPAERWITSGDDLLS